MVGYDRPTGMKRPTLPMGAAAVLAVMLVIGGPIARVYACSCVELQPGQALGNADVAFVGVVAGVRDPSAANAVVSSADPVRYTFAVQEVMKQGVAIRGVVEVSSARAGASCGQIFAVGQRWRLYANRDGADLSTGICSGNELLAERVPVPALSEAESGPPPIGLLIVLGTSSLVALVSIWAFTRRGRSPSA
jgi:hypothetical protein